MMQNGCAQLASEELLSRRRKDEVIYIEETGMTGVPTHNSDLGVAAALRFLAAVRRDPTLRERVAALDPDAGLPAVTTIAGAAGFRITVQELRAAHAQDWGLRGALALRRGQAASAATTAAVVKAPSSST